MTSYRYGYVRVSTMEQDPAGQLDAMTVAGVDEARVFVEYASSVNRHTHPLASLNHGLTLGLELIKITR